MNQTFQFCPSCKSSMAPGPGGYNTCLSAECTYIQYENPTPVVAAIIEYGENQILLGHNIKWPPKWFALITGFLEKHEHPDECVIREVKEEVGLDAEIVSFVGHYTFKRMNQIILAYHVKATGEIVLEDELDDVRIVPFEKVKTWPGGTGRALKDFLEAKGYEVEEISFNEQS